jgi:WD40 repeat protein
MIPPPISAPKTYKSLFSLFRKKSHAKFYDMKGGVRSVDFDESRRLMVTVGADREVRVWSLKELL